MFLSWRLGLSRLRAAADAFGAVPLAGVHAPTRPAPTPATRALPGRGPDARTSCVLLALERPPRSGLEAGLPGGFCYRFATPADGREVWALYGGIHPDRYIEHVHRGDRCLLQIHQEAGLVGISWVATSPLPYLCHGVHLNLPGDLAFSSDPFDAGGTSNAPRRAQRDWNALNLLRGEGKKRIMTMVPEAEAETLLALSGRAYREVGEVRIVRRSGWVHLDIEIEEAFWCRERRL